MSARGHVSDSAVQRRAEEVILRQLSRDVGLSLSPQPITLGTVKVHVDGVDADETLLAEVYARQGALKGAQLKKISQDVLKLALLRRDERFANARTLIAFASEEARDSVRGWLREAAEQLEVELVVVDVPEELRADIRQAQARQKMTNVSVPAEDLAPDVSLSEVSAVGEL